MPPLLWLLWNNTVLNLCRGKSIEETCVSICVILLEGASWGGHENLKYYIKEI
jgi:hypothetical protein